MTVRFVLPVHLGHSTEEGVYNGADAIAKTFGASRQAVMRWVKLGAPIVKIGGKYQCQHAELWEWLKENKNHLYPKKESKTDISEKHVN
jgi:phage terminase Nu1 subunit (DNA packaging protein)